MKKIATFLAAALIVLMGCSTPSTVAPFSFALNYKPMASPGESPSLSACATVSQIDVTDAREQKAVGKRFVEGKSAAVAPVTVTTDISAWVKKGLEESLKRAGGSTGVTGAPILHVTIDEIVTNENVLHRAGYDGRISLSAELRASDGRSCWKGTASGMSENYGYAGSAENYTETLNHALDRASNQLLSNREFKAAICGGCGS